MSDDGLAMFQQYAAWLTASGGLTDADRRSFYTDGMVVLDTNVLLSLYEYTTPARNQILAALEQISERMWLPYQVGLEFVRGRHRVIEKRTSRLKNATVEADRRLSEIKKTLEAASRDIEHLLEKYAYDEQAATDLKRETADSLAEQIPLWRKMLLVHVDKMKKEQDIVLNRLDADDDPVLRRVAELYGDRIGSPPLPEVTRRRVSEAIDYRFPNRIPPGFADFGKDGEINSAGDFLLWEEVIEKAKSLPGPRRVLLISGDVKEDWYEPPEKGRGERPWPSLHDEMRQRADSSLCLEKPTAFFQGVKKFLDVELAEQTFEEIDRASDVLTTDGRIRGVVTEENAVDRYPPSGLVIDSFRSVGLAARSLRFAARTELHTERLFQWWIIGVTVELGRREPVDGEPLIVLSAAVRSVDPPTGEWVPGTSFELGAWPNPSSLWVAPWFVSLMEASTVSDARTLRMLAVQQMKFRDGA
ncbi:hypothetical protein DFR70_105357 [Nocardia tenerifensis]|uniref:PIN like domain-containing protein n=1 Tax=Nocardia tenerifensis TaxID=228006 RepID=A0A318JZR1_9NOCA|nr:PIN-like domain-containing protein [Nocardia tenerifensis]PXX64172.1 hypothetical protein DFR70_105357 [Nocardia tenerifensis]